MIKNYIKIAFRNLLLNKLYTTLNVLGLTFGLSCFLLIGLYLYDELTFDQQHENKDRIYRLVEHRKTDSEEKNTAAISYKLSEEATKSISEIENIARVTQFGRDNLGNIDGRNKFLLDINVANNGLMEMFDFEAVDGNPKTALKDPGSMVIVEDLAMKLFGDTKAVGR
ncbi:MAG TPA: ABC transporter permease, partial [Saprospiraceae bacterium]|nr:ABC transporter permease [Saprospiraceae bacterium]